MKTRSRVVYLLPIVILLFLSFIFQAPLGAQAQTDREGNIPYLLAPKGTIVDRTPSYSWTVITNATKYQYQVWKGDTKVLDKIAYPGKCNTVYCLVTPAFQLGYNVYVWRARAYVDGVWRAWGAKLTFTVTPNSFYSGFSGNMTGWERKAGGTWNTSTSLIYTEGLAEKHTSVYRKAGQYTDFEYTVRMRRIGGENTYNDPTNMLLVRMGNKIDPGHSHWYPGYQFGIRNNGKYYISFTDNTGKSITIQPWTDSSAIIKGAYNILKVKAQGSDFAFYINGVLVKSFSDTHRARGYIGISMYRYSDGSTPTYLYVDWAKLSVIQE
jgi:hypothetical protein